MDEFVIEVAPGAHLSLEMTGTTIYRFGRFELDEATFELRCNGSVVPVQPKVYDVLHVLVQRPNVVVTHDELLARVWRGVTVSRDAIAHALRSLRKALGDDVKSPSYITTHRCRGYQFIAPVYRLSTSLREDLSGIYADLETSMRC